MSGGIVSGDFVFNLEKRMRVVNELNYMGMLTEDDTWHPKLLRARPLDGKSERLLWLLSTASIEQTSPADGGENPGAMNFDELATVMAEYFPASHRKGYKIGKLKMLNLMAAGVNAPERWAGDVGTYGAYYPQRLLAIAILNGENVNGYDGVPFFSTSHPTHPLIPALGTYANLFTGASAPASGLTPAYPGALPIDDTQTMDVAFKNFSIALAYITGAISQPNGQGDPRFLRPKFVLHPPRMTVRVTQLLDQQFFAQAAAGGAGAADVKNVLKKYQLAEPVLAKELDGSRSYSLNAMQNPTGAAATLTGDDKTYYIVCEEASQGEIGAYMNNMRLPFALHTYSGESGTEGIDAILGRQDDLEWHYKGFFAVNQGLPYTIFKFKGA